MFYKPDIVSSYTLIATNSKMQAIKTFLPLVYLYTLICYTESAKILMLFTLPARSHYILGSSLARGLAERGHDVTMVSPYKEKVLPKNGTYRDITLPFPGMFEEMQKTMSNRNMFEIGEANPMIHTIFIVNMMHKRSVTTFEDENFKKLIASKEKFDVVIVEQFFNDAMKALSTHFNAPLILFSSIGPNYWVNPIVGNPSPPSYVPDVRLTYSSRMTFCERLVNSLMYISNSLIYNLYFFPKQNELIKKYIPNGPELDDVLYNASIVLLNSHPSLNQPVPKVPNMIDIGGFHVKPPQKLPQDLQKFLDNATEGVIYFSMGSNLKSSMLPKAKREAILKTFAKLKEKILWKWEEDELPGQPSNVKLGKWLPQQDILAHPNVKLFITHGGLLSTIETVYHGVPILAIPIFGDQKLNARRAVNEGYGLTVPYTDISEEIFTKSIEELLTNPKFKKNAKEKSRIFHDRQASPMDTAAFWVEYVIRHRGAPHLRVAALDLPWYKYHLLDVISFMVFVCLSFIFAFCYIIKTICCKKTSKKLKKQ